MCLSLVIKRSIKFAVKYCLLLTGFGLDKLNDLNNKSHQITLILLTEKMQIFRTPKQLLPSHLLICHPEYLIFNLQNSLDN